MITLYVKVHLDTGLKYFGKTCQRDPHRYKGSGKYWLRHLSKHGNNVETIVVARFEDDEIDKAIDFAVNFSNEHDIVRSEEWANLVAETTLGGPVFGSSMHDPLGSSRLAIAESSRAMWRDPEKRRRIVQAHKARWKDPVIIEKGRKASRENWTPERRAAHSERIKQLQSLGNYEGTVSTAKKSKTHAAAIGLALKGKKKTLDHIVNLKWSRIGGAKGFDNYVGYSEFCFKSKSNGLATSTIAELTETSWQAVHKAIKFWPRLKEYRETK